MYKFINEILQKFSILYILRTKRESTDIHFFDGFIELRHSHVVWLTVTREENVTCHDIYEPLSAISPHLASPVGEG